MPFAPQLGFFGSVQEWIVILVLGLLLFGRRLPEVGRQVGRGVAELRRHVDQFRAELDRDESLRGARDAIHDARRGLRDLGRETDPSRQLPSPKSVMADLTRSAKEAGSDTEGGRSEVADGRDAASEKPKPGEDQPSD